MIFRSTDQNREDMIGLYGDLEINGEPTLIDLKTIFEVAEVDSAFFVPENSMRTNEDGFYFHSGEIDDIDGNCQ